MGIGSGNGLTPNRRQAITWTNADPVPWGLYAALGGDEINISRLEQHNRDFIDNTFKYTFLKRKFLHFVLNRILVTITPMTMI